MQFFIIAFSFICFIISYTKEKNIYNPMTLFFLYWFIVIALASMELYDIHSASQQTYGLIGLGLVSFAVGFLMKLKSSSSKIKKKYKTQYVVRYKIYIVLNILIILFLFFRLIALVTLLREGYSWWSIRLMTTGVEKGFGLWGSELNLVIYTYLVSPLVYLAIPIAVIDYLVEKKSKVFVWTTVIVVILFSIVTVSRNALVFSIIYLIFGSMIYGKHKKISEKIKKTLKKAPIIILLLAIGVGTITLLRKASAVFLKEAYVYLTGAIPSLSERLTEPFAELRTYGMLSTRGFTRIIFILLDKIGIHYPESYLTADDILDNLEGFIPIGKGINMNAYATMFYDFYIDGGLVGIILGSIILGYICRRVYIGVKYNINICNTVFYLLIIQQLLFSMARIYSVYPTRALPFILILFMFKRIKVRSDDTSVT